MLKQRNINLKLFLATISTVTGIHSVDLSIASQLTSGSDLSNKAISTSAQPNDRDTIQDGELIAQKSGGRSGGGSFKKRSSGSKSRSSGSSSTTRKSSSSRSSTRRSSTPSYDSTPTYRRTPRRTHTYTHTRSHSSHSEPVSWLGKLLITLIILLVVGVPTFIVLFLIFKALFNNNLPDRDSDLSEDRVGQKISRERDNNKVTVSQLQIALSPQAEGLQQELSSLSLNVNTDTDEGLVELMRESVLILLRHNRAWNHVLASSNSLHIDRAEETFDKISFAERGKFSSESLSNIDGQIKTAETVYYDGDNYPAYIVVTLILGTADDNPLFFKLHTEQQVQKTLLKLAAMRADYLMKFELLWTPQKPGEYLTDDELLMEYTNMIKLV